VTAAYGALASESRLKTFVTEPLKPASYPSARAIAGAIVQSGREWPTGSIDL
jgi:hypothetical protein